MTREEFNIELRAGLAVSRENDMPDFLKEILFKIILLNSVNDRYKFLSGGDKINCEVKAYQDCCRLAVKYNPEKSEAYAYVMQIIRSSYAGTIVKIFKSNQKKKDDNRTV